MLPASLSIAVDERLLKSTRSRCPKCHSSCPAEVWMVGAPSAKVFLRHCCPQHGETSTCIASDARFYWLAQGKPQNSDCCETAALNKTMPVRQACCAATGRASGTLGRNAQGRGESPFETLSTCLALIE